MDQLTLPFDQPISTSRILYYSRDFARLEESLVREVEKVRDGCHTRTIVVAVPSSGLGRRISHLLTGGGIKVLNLKQLAQLLCQVELFARNLVEIPPMGEELAARKAIRNAVSPDSPIHPFVESRGLLQVFMSLVKDFRQGGFEQFDDLEALAAVMEREGGGALDREKMTTVLRMLDGFRKGFSATHYDAEDVILEGARNSSSFNGLTGARDLFFYGFFSLDQTQRRLVRELSKNASTRVFFPHVPENPASVELMEFFRGAGFETRNAKGAPSALDYLRENFLALSPSAPPPGISFPVSITTCPDTESEARECARRIIDLALDGTPFDRMAVVLRNREVYQNLFTDSFEALGIPYCLHQGRPLSSTPGGKTLNLLLNMTGMNLPRFEVMEFFTDGAVRFDLLLEAEGEQAPARWEQLSRKAGVRQGLSNWRSRLRALQNRRQDELDRMQDNADRKVCEESVRDAKNLLEAVEKLNRYVSSINRNGRWRDFADTFAAIVRQLIDDEKNLEALVTVVEGLGRLDRLESKVDFETFAGFLRERLNRVPVPSGGYMQGCVNIYNGIIPAGMTADHVIVAGMLSGEYPGVHRENPLMSDREREVFNSVYNWEGTLLLRRQLQEQEDYQAALLLGSARMGIHFTFPREGLTTGGQGMPSRYLLKIGSLTAGRQIYQSNLDLVPGFVYADGDTVPGDKAGEPLFLDSPEMFLHHFRRAGDDEKRKGILVDVAALDNDFDLALKEFCRRRTFPTLTESDGLVVLPELLQALSPLVDGMFSPASASGFEEYHTCPYRFFLHRVMEISPLEAPEEIRGLSPQDRGLLYHKIFQRFYQEMKSNGRLPLQPEMVGEYLQGIDAIACDEFEQIKNDGVVGSESAWFEKTLEISRGLELFIQEETGGGELMPDRFELSFGMRDPDGGDSLPPARIELDRDCPLRLRGRIDRVDVSPLGDRWEIIDYKTSRSEKYKNDSLAGGRQLQLPLYLMALAGLLKDLGGLERARALYYFATPKGDFKKVGIEGGMVKERKRDLSILISAVINGAREGFFPPYPGDRKLSREGCFDGENCGICDYRSICPRDVTGIYRLKTADRRLQSFDRMKEIQ